MGRSSSGAVAFDLIEEAIGKASGRGATLVGVFAGCGAFFGGDVLIDRAGGARRKSAHGREVDESALAIVLGTVLDGIPESVVIGLTFYESGAVGAAYLLAVFISNIPEAISSTAGLTSSGWRPQRILGMWTSIALVSGLASLTGTAASSSASSRRSASRSRCSCSSSTDGYVSTAAASSAGTVTSSGMPIWRASARSR